MFRKILLIILAACEVFLCYTAFFKKKKPAVDREPITSCTELPERYMNDRETDLYRQTIEALRKVSIGETGFYFVMLELSEPFESSEEFEAAADKVEFFVDKYVPEYTYWLNYIGFVGDGEEYTVLYFSTSPEYTLEYDYDDFDFYDDDYDYDEVDFEKYNYIPAEKIETAQRAIANAKEIAAKYQGKSDYEKVMGYAEEICKLVEYDHEAADNDIYNEKISPWRIINVFDGDPETNVVCEGYALAFEYLCGLGGVECHYTTGDMDGGAHGWNTVVLDGVSYFVDVTACDTTNYTDAEIKRAHPFILAGVSEVEPEGFTSRHIGKKSYYSSRYTYGKDTVKYTPEELRLVSEKAYPTKKTLYLLMGVGAVGIVLCALSKIKRFEKTSDETEIEQRGEEL